MLRYSVTMTHCNLKAHHSLQDRNLQAHCHLLKKERLSCQYQTPSRIQIGMRFVGRYQSHFPKLVKLRRLVMTCLTWKNC